jgi:hypothetical protein
MIEDRDPTHACCWRVPVALQVRLLEPGVLARRRVPWATRTPRIIRTTARPHGTSYGSMPSPRLHVRGSDGAPYHLFAGAQASAPLTLSLVRGVGDAVDFQPGGGQQCDLAAVIAQLRSCVEQYYYRGVSHQYPWPATGRRWPWAEKNPVRPLRLPLALARGGCPARSDRPRTSRPRAARQEFRGPRCRARRTAERSPGRGSG